MGKRKEFGIVCAFRLDTRFSIHVGVGAPVAPAPVVVAPPPYPYGGYYYAPCPISRLRMASGLLRRIRLGAWRLGSARLLRMVVGTTNTSGTTNTTGAAGSALRAVSRLSPASRRSRGFGPPQIFCRIAPLDLTKQKQRRKREKWLFQSVLLRKMRHEVQR